MTKRKMKEFIWGEKKPTREDLAQSTERIQELLRSAD